MTRNNSEWIGDLFNAKYSRLDAAISGQCSDRPAFIFGVLDGPVFGRRSTQRVIHSKVLKKCFTNSQFLIEQICAQCVGLFRAWQCTESRLK